MPDDLLPQLRVRGWPPADEVKSTASAEILSWRSGPMTLHVTRVEHKIWAELLNIKEPGREPVTLHMQRAHDAAAFLDPWRRHFVTSPRPDETEIGEVTLQPLPIYAARLARGSLTKHVRYLASIPARNECDDQRLHQLAEESAAFSVVVRAIDAALQGAIE